MTATFYLGIHHPNWLEQERFRDVPLFVSSARMQDRKTLPRAVGRFAIDSGGFSMIRKNGKWTHSAEKYVELVRWYIRDIGQPDFVAPMDWMCEPWVIEGRRDVDPKSQHWFHGTREARSIPMDGPDEPMADAIRKHQTWTVENYVRLCELAPEVDWIPVVQGWPEESYLECVQMYEDAGVDLTKLPRVGLGSVCRREATKEAEDIVLALRKRGITEVHAFGMKSQGLQRVGDIILSGDSMAWSYGGMKTPTYCGSTTHKNEANCAVYALDWREKLLASVARAAVERARRAAERARQAAKQARRGHQPKLFELEPA